MYPSTPPSNRNGAAITPGTPTTRARTSDVREDIAEVARANTPEGVNALLAYGAGNGKKWYPKRLSEDYDTLTEQLRTICIMGRPGDGLMVDDAVLRGLAESMLSRNRKCKKWRGLAVYAFAAACNEYDKCHTCLSYGSTMFAAWIHLRDGTFLPDRTTSWNNVYDLIPVTIEWCYEHLKPVEFN